MSSDRSDAEARRRARATWPIACHALGREPSDDLPHTTTPQQRIAMMTELSEAAFAIAGQVPPRYTRSNMPGRIIRPG
jgi:hypothetical protein